MRRSFDAQCGTNRRWPRFPPRRGEALSGFADLPYPSTSTPARVTLCDTSFSGFCVSLSPITMA
jgi:hypothetical protein